MLNWIDLLKDYKDKREAVALITVTHCLGSTPCVVGARMIVAKNKEIHGTIGGGKLEFNAIDEAIIAINENRIITSNYTLGPEFEQCCGGKVELIIEPMNQYPKLFVFGAGHIGVEICNMMENTPFEVHLIDSRANWFSKIPLKAHVNKHETKLNDFKTFKDAVQWGNQSYVLVLTHDHKLDFDIIAMALKQKTKFLGLIGSKTKRVRFNNLLIKEMHIKEGMSNVVCPIGLELGGNSPKEIAISVVAQLIQIHYKGLPEEGFA
ncbi:xanthine dehydrogenase accessory protein XdhC [Hwangdonia lutea]|uniref:Xanthine dehydrogenase accessory protein XdhC n=1 Tax=Hwangdonia lutea TaxID=3075823 RepID=A0AA97HSF2_9FLAO|nr:xanthine dehydrogenase accessory protein XdhC [Hwangdonia sp. SCSIO 19198]WOD44433.1 xanthine dehydrogenase accessory protein XdhC [Hwangdonia sp. SCSIO 19198]